MSQLAKLKIILGIQIITVPLVVLVFRIIEPRILAASLAGGWFCFSGTVVVLLSYRFPPRFRNAVFVASSFFTFVVAYPMLIVRSLNWSVALSEVRIWGIPGDIFHHLSNLVYLVMVACTVFELMRQRRSLSKASRNA